MENIETLSAKVAVLKEELAGRDAANGLLMDALLLVIRQQLPKLIHPMQTHFEQMAARPQSHLSEIAQGALDIRAQAMVQKLQLLQAAQIEQSSAPKLKPLGKRR